MRKFTTHRDRVHHVHLPRVLVETAVVHGALREALFEGTDLTQEMLTNPDMRVSFNQYGKLAENALRLTGNPALGLDVGRNTGIAQMGIVGILLQNTPTVGAALEMGLRYSEFTAPGWNFSLAVKGEEATLTFAETIALGKQRVFATEVVLASFDTQARALYGGPLPIRRARMAFAEPAHSKLYRERLYDVPMAFGERATSVDFDAEILEQVLPFADPATAKLAERMAAQVFPVSEVYDGLVAQVRRLLENTSGTPPTLAELAQRLQTSTRSLRRELQQMRTSYSELLDESRRVRAEKWMATTSMPLERLAADLGFSHVRSFRRAYKRWTGRAPGLARPRRR